jgi:hypothetical protein
VEPGEWREVARTADERRTNSGLSRAPERNRQCALFFIRCWQIDSGRLSS